MAKAKGRVFNKIAVVMKSGEPIKVEQFNKSLLELQLNPYCID